MMTGASGLLIIDKPRGPTSHDVVGRVRRALGTRDVGHAGTLDPMATGVLLVMVGACTKLSRFLTLEDKIYETTVRLGTSTDTLDAEGAVTTSMPLPSILIDSLQRMERGGEAERVIADAIQVERARTSQVPPAHSAIKQGGVASYRRARKGLEVELPAREVRVLSMHVLGACADPPELRLELHVSKGYYVRALARDLGEALGVPAHLTALRRLRSGVWGLDGAMPVESDPAELIRALRSVEAVARECLPWVRMTDEGSRRALFGQPLADADFETPPGEEPTAWFTRGDRLVAVGDRSRGRPTVLRGFLSS